MNHFVKNLYWLIGEIIKDIFRISLAALIVFFAIEVFEPGLVSNHLSFNLLLIFCLIFGIITALWHSKEQEIKMTKTKGTYFWGFIFGLIIMLLIGWQTYHLDLFGYLIPLLAGLITTVVFGVIQEE